MKPTDTPNRFARIALLLALAPLGCDRTDTPAPPKPSPQARASDPLPPPVSSVDTTQPTTPADVVQAPAATAPTAEARGNPPVFMMIDQRRETFPPAKLALSDTDGHVTATLYSDDPKEAIKPDYTGNAFYLSMPLDVPDMHSLNQSVWHFQTSSRERADTPFGIFLQGNRVAVQPLDVQVKFETRDDALILWMTGNWLKFDAKDDAAPPREIALTAMITPEVKMKASDK